MHRISLTCPPLDPQSIKHRQKILPDQCCHCIQNRWRPYRVECTGSLSTSGVKRHRARLVLGWGTAWEHLRVLPAFAPFPHTHTHPHPQQPVGQRFEGAKSAAPCPHRRTRINSTSRTLRLKLAHSAVNAARPSMGPSGTMPASTLLSVFGARESQAGTIRRAK